MASSIEDRLARREFQHEAGTTLTGEIVKISEAEWKFGYYPVLVVRDDDGNEHILSCYLSLSWLAEPVIAHRPKVGERLGLRCDEPETANDGKQYNRGHVEFDRDEDVEPDWDRMIESRRRDRDSKLGNNDSADNGGSDSFAKVTEKWKAATKDEGTPPF
jgi:hypothetical protein